MQKLWASDFWNWEISYLWWTIENTHFSNFITWFFKIYTFLGEMALIFFIASFVMIGFKKTRKTGFVVLAGLVIVAGFNNYGLKYIFNRPRPFRFEGSGEHVEALSNLVEVFKNESKFNEFLVPSLGSKSFVSGHTLSAFIFGTTVAIYHRKWAVPALFAAALMAYSRLYFGFHYPTDIIGGIIIAIPTSFIIARIADKHGEKISAYFINLFRRIFKRNKEEQDEQPQEDAN